jgi:hypothetical protein
MNETAMLKTASNFLIRTPNKPMDPRLHVEPLKYEASASADTKITSTAVRGSI